MNDTFMRALFGIPFLCIVGYWASGLLEALPFRRSTPLTVLLWIIGAGVCLLITAIILLYIFGAFEKKHK